MAYFRNYGVDVRIARIFNTYGEKIREDGVYARALPRFITQTLKELPISIYGDGSQTRRFTHVSDTIRGILKLATVLGLVGEVFNIGNTNEITILKLAEAIVGKTGSSSKFTFSPLGQDDPKRGQPGDNKGKAKTRLDSAGNLEGGLDHTMEYFRQKNNLQMS